MIPAAPALGQLLQTAGSPPVARVEFEDAVKLILGMLPVFLEQRHLGLLLVEVDRPAPGKIIDGFGPHCLTHRSRGEPVCDRPEPHREPAGRSLHLCWPMLRQVGQVEAIDNPLGGLTNHRVVVRPVGIEDGEQIGPLELAQFLLDMLIPRAQEDARFPANCFERVFQKVILVGGDVDG